LLAAIYDPLDSLYIRDVAVVSTAAMIVIVVVTQSSMTAAAPWSMDQDGGGRQFFKVEESLGIGETPLP
jgi:hypothetical protein